MIFINGFPIQIYGSIQCDIIEVFDDKWQIDAGQQLEWRTEVRNLIFDFFRLCEGEGEEVDNVCDNNEEASEGDINISADKTDCNRESNNHIHRSWWSYSK